MKVLLKKDVKGQGKAGQVVEVSDGYARNYLLPHGLAETADAQNVNEAKVKQGALNHKKDMEKQAAQNLAAKLEGMELVLQVKCGDGNRLFGSITAKEISEELKKQKNINIDKKKFVLKGNIKELGEYIIQVKLYALISANIKVIIKAG
ncbi:MAG: 50S ribosomal protein L9 [Eubacteriales bacterium]